ncbi:MAG: radical SAM protein [Candidatus Rokubacteria bacterium]|nr:radical SAM protein [Candidatus Rokubacteria bacterium]MBI3109262.1 radical SAM protein [Candidatus Rokubacteria bacterium]
MGPRDGPTAYAVSWNLTRRCNLHCDHCYISAGPGPRPPDELSTAECRRVMDEIAEVNPDIFLILTGGEPLLRPDLPEIASAARARGFTVVVGTNGVLLRERQAQSLHAAGVQGVSLSLDSTVPARHDAFRRRPGSWQGAVRATEICRAEGLDFSLHMSVTEWNAREIPAMIELAGELGATVLNLFFLVRCGRGEGLTDIPAAQYEAILTDLVEMERAGGRPGGLQVRTKCAPQYRRLVWQRDKASPLLAAYAEGACPAGKHYCRITPEGDVTPSPYMPLSVGNLREGSFADLWRSAPVFQALRTAPLRGRCGACEFSKICGGCRCRAYAASGDYLAEDPACAYEPGTYGGVPAEVPAAFTFGLEVSRELAWSEAATARLEAIPGFARGMVVQAVEAHARAAGHSVVTPEMMAEVRRHWGGRFAQRS